MAKKKFGLSSTLNKNKLEEPVLPKKIPLTKSSKDLKDVKEKVEALHEAAVRVIDKVEEPLIELTLNVEDENIGKIVRVVQDVSKAEVVEVVEKKAKVPKVRKAIPEKPERMVRITVDTPKTMHVKLKIKAIEHDITIRDYVIGLIKDDLGLK
ncbi:MAG: hypothetical protein ACJAUH_001268 [Saprospiraceae bacterium]|jgi:hypothetical protein